MKLFYKSLIKPNSNRVAKYYSEWNERYIKSFGDIIQASKTTDKNVLIDHYINVMGLKDGMKILDAGCGIGGCGIYFLKEKNLHIEGLTVSKDQVILGQKKIDESGFKDNFIIRQGDYHCLTKYYKKESFDLIYFLESIVHSNRPDLVIRECFKVLKKGGYIYIKDQFKGISASLEEKNQIEQAIVNCNKYFSVRIINLDDILKLLRENNFYLLFAREIDIESDFSDVNSFIADNNIKIHSRKVSQIEINKLKYLIFYEILARKFNV